MAEIDKPLPNTKTTVEVPGEVEIQEAIKENVEEVQEKGGPVEIEMTEEGGAEVSFDPKVAAMEGGEDHFENLAEFLGEEILDPLGSKLFDQYNEYKESRGDWEQTYRNGLELLGFKYERRTEPFRGASGVNHPVLAEAVTQFQAQAYKELLPADGPVRTQIMGTADVAKEEQAKRVKDFMNYQIMDQMKEYEPEFDQMLFYLPLSGSTFKKVYYDDLLGRAVSKFVPAEDLVVPYSATSLEDAEAVIHVLRISQNDLRKQQINGFYRDIDLGEPPLQQDQLKQKELELEGIQQNGTEDMYTVLEMHVNLDLDGYEDINPEDDEPTGIKLPYIVTLDEANGKVLSIRRNYKAEDPLKRKQDYFVHFKFLPGLGFYGFGLIHMIGGLSRTATAALRQLLDAGTLSNLPAGFKMRGIRVRDEAQPLQPGEFRDVDAPGGNLRDAFMPLPFKGPDATLLQLLSTVVQSGQRFASIADMQVGDGNQSAAVGTTVALLERGSRVMSAIHKRLYQAMKCEFMLIADNFATYLPKQYPYDVVGGQRQIFASDFDNRIDIIPVADPNIFSQTQRISIAQSEMQIAMTNPQMHNIYHAYRHMYEALGVKDIDQLLPPPPKPTALDPASENILALNGKKFQAFPKQDHQAHMKSHLRFMGTTVIRNNPAAMGMLQQNCMEHILLMATEQVDMEFAEEKQKMEQLMQQVQPIMQQAQQNPQMQQQLQQNPQLQQLQQQETNLQIQMEARKAQLISEFSDDFAEAEKEVLNQVENDPLLKLKDRELDLKAREEQARQDEAEDKLNLERAKMMQSRELAEDKMEQNDEHQKLRASVSLAKDGIKNMQATIKSGEV